MIPGDGRGLADRQWLEGFRSVGTALPFPPARWNFKYQYFTWKWTPNLGPGHPSNNSTGVNRRAHPWPIAPSQVGREASLSPS